MAESLVDNPTNSGDEEARSLEQELENRTRSPQANLPNGNNDGMPIGGEEMDMEGGGRSMKQEISDQQLATLYVSGLARHLKDEELRELFSPYGQLVRTQVVMDPHTKENRGFGFVSYEQDMEAEAAIAALHNKEHCGRVLAVERARRDKPRSPTPGRYFGPSNREAHRGRERDNHHGRMPPPRTYRSREYDRDRERDRGRERDRDRDRERERERSLDRGSYDRSGHDRNSYDRNPYDRPSYDRGNSERGRDRAYYRGEPDHPKDHRSIDRYEPAPPRYPANASTINSASAPNGYYSGRDRYGGEREYRGYDTRSAPYYPPPPPPPASRGDYERASMYPPPPTAGARYEAYTAPSAISSYGGAPPIDYERRYPPPTTSSSNNLPPPPRTRSPPSYHHR